MLYISQLVSRISSINSSLPFGGVPNATLFYFQSLFRKPAKRMFFNFQWPCLTLSSFHGQQHYNSSSSSNSNSNSKNNNNNNNSHNQQASTPTVNTNNINQERPSTTNDNRQPASTTTRTTSNPRRAHTTPAVPNWSHLDFASLTAMLPDPPSRL